MAATKKSKKKIITKKKVNTKPKKPNQKLDWDALREEWIQSDISLAGLADKYEISMASVRNHYHRKEWKKRLDVFKELQQEAYDGVMKAKAADLGRRAAVLDEHILHVSEKIVDVIETQVDKLSKARSLDKIKAAAVTMKVASEALKNSHHNIRLAVDKATEIIDDKSKPNFTDEEKQRIREELNLVPTRKGKE